MQKNFDDVAIAYRKPFLKPEEIQSDLSLYRAVTLETSSGRIERILIQFDQNKVKSIEIGGALLDAVAKWPENMPDEATIHLNDPIDEIREKLLAIYQNPIYEKYQIVLSDKWLEKPFDPDMINFNEWYFTFTTDISTSRSGVSAVSLFFKEGKLSKIQHYYNEAEMLN